MTRDDIIAMAREAGCMGIDDYYTNGPVRAFSDDQLERFTALVAQHEREICARVCDDLGNRLGMGREPDPDDCAAAIRARGETK